jgi:hypothetical protein
MVRAWWGYFPQHARGSNMQGPTFGKGGQEPGVQWKIFTRYLEYVSGLICDALPSLCPMRTRMANVLGTDPALRQSRSRQNRCLTVGLSLAGCKRIPGFHHSIEETSLRTADHLMAIRASRWCMKACLCRQRLPLETCGFLCVGSDVCLKTIQAILAQGTGDGRRDQYQATCSRYPTYMQP